MLQGKRGRRFKAFWRGQRGKLIATAISEIVLVVGLIVIYPRARNVMNWPIKRPEISNAVTVSYPDNLLKNHYVFVWQVPKGVQDVFRYVRENRKVNASIIEAWRSFKVARRDDLMIVPLNVQHWSDPDEEAVDSVFASAERMRSLDVRKIRFK